MKIAQVAPLFESVPPRFYGGTERIVSYLTEDLVRRGHEVTLYASADSKTSATLVSACPKALRLDDRIPEPAPYQAIQLGQILRDAADYDIIHFHNEYFHLPASLSRGLPFVHTMHHRSDAPELRALFEMFPKTPMISVSHAQQAALPGVSWRGSVLHGLPEHLLECNLAPQPYLAFLGRISIEKQVHHAVEIARRAGLPLKIAAKLDREHDGYYETVVRPLLSTPGVEYVGELGDSDKQDFLGHASALLFPINWPEPFGLVMIEALACGTPVIAYPRGSVREVVRDGVTGWIVDGIDEAVAAVQRLDEIDRAQCRADFVTRFSAARMTDDYLRLYESISLCLAGCARYGSA
ncbi:MAG: glycosyltransferase family 4 protein [Acidiferrobacteraceae bacterium]